VYAPHNQEEERMAKRISQLLVIVGGIQAETKTRMDQLLAVVRKEDNFTGQEKNYRQLSDDGKAALPANSSKKVRISAGEVLNRAAVQLSRQFDTQLSVDAANQLAKGDIKIGKETLVTSVPVGHLLYLERELGIFATLVEALPVLDMAKEWNENNVLAGQHRTPAVEQNYNNKVLYNWHRGNGTPTIQEQVDVMTRDEPVGIVTTIDYSGAIEPARKAAILDRVARLRAEIKMAREEANAQAVQEREEGAALFSWLLTGE
jgi:hypothetical protein